MEKIWNLVEPYFQKQFLNVSLENSEQDIIKTHNLIQELGVSPKTYFNIVFYPRTSETLSNFRIRPKHLHSDWALLKFKHGIALKKLSPVNLEIEFIKHTRSIVGPKYFLSMDGILPSYLDDIRKRRISLCYTCCNKEFKRSYRNLPKDIKCEFFENIDVVYIERNTRINRRLMKEIGV